MDIVTIPESTKFLLTSCIPAVEADLAAVSEEIQGVDLHTDNTHAHTSSRTRQSNASSQRWLTRAAVADDDELEAGVVHRLLIRER
ncbi:Os01g0611050, partial [Oryza sativa Japonica Group]